MQTQEQTQTPQVLPLPASIGAELKAGGAKRQTKEKGKKGVAQPVKGGLNLKLAMSKVADALESSRTKNVETFLAAAKTIKEPENVLDAAKVLQGELTERKFPSAAVRASEFAAVAFAWHYDPAGTESAVLMGVPKMKDGKEVTDQDGNPIMLRPSETIILKRLRNIRRSIPEGEPGHTKKGSTEAKTASKLNATQFARCLDYIKVMDKAQWETFGKAYEAEQTRRTKPAAKKPRKPKAEKK